MNIINSLLNVSKIMGITKSSRQLFPSRMFSWFTATLLIYQYCIAHTCVVKLINLELNNQQYNGSWFRIAHMGPTTDYLPSDIDASLIKMVPTEGVIGTVEYYERNGTCYGPFEGKWIKQMSGHIMRVQNKNGKAFEMIVKTIFHEYSGENNEEMNIVLYGCQTFETSGNCRQGEEMASLLSNSRHPQTLALFKSAKTLEDSTCIDILQLRKLNTYSSCGEEIVDDNHKLSNALLDSEGELIENECKVKNFPYQIIGEFFDEPRILTVTAFIDPFLAYEDITHISCLFQTKSNASCYYVRYNKCYQSNLYQKFTDGNNIESSITVELKNGTKFTIDWSGTMLWQNGDEYITYKCIDINEDGTCDQYKIYVWSDEDLMDQPTIHTIYDQLDTICADPTDLIFLNTFHECDERIFTIEPDVKCGPMTGWTPINLELLLGVWFFAADINADPKIYIQSAVVELTIDPTKNNAMIIKFFAKRESDSKCIGPGSGTVTLLKENSTLNVNIRYQYDSLLDLHNSYIQWQNQILYLDNQRMLLYWCFKRENNGSCTQYDVDILVRSRHLAYHDLSLLEPYLNASCVHQEQLRWFDLHSLCGFDISETTGLRRTVLTLSHSEVLDILTDVQEPQCKKNQLKGIKADLSMIERAGKWFLLSRYDHFHFITFAMIGRLTIIESGKAVIKVYESAARPGLDKHCFRRMAVLIEKQNGDDFMYYLYYESLLGAKSYLILRFLFLNRHVGVVYACLAYNSSGGCINRMMYVLSRHDSIDHAELSVLESIANSVCIPKEHITHLSVHDACVYENHNIKLGTLICSSITTLPKAKNYSSIENELRDRFRNNTYFAIASTNQKSKKFLVKFEDGQAKRVFDRNGRCIERNINAFLIDGAENLVVINEQELVLLSPFGLSSALIIQSAQFSGDYPCLNPIKYSTDSEGECDALKLQSCEPESILVDFEKLNGVWILQEALHTTVTNVRCIITDSKDENKKIIECQVESIDSECMRKNVMQMSVTADGAYSLEMREDFPLYLNPEVGIDGKIAFLSDKFIILYTEFVDGKVTVLGERKITVWTREGIEIDDTVRNVLNKLCILIDEMDNKTGTSECW